MTEHLTDHELAAIFEFIAAARTDLPAVVKELIEARRLLEEWSHGHWYAGDQLDLEQRTRAFLGGEK